MKTYVGDRLTPEQWNLKPEEILDIFIRKGFMRPEVRDDVIQSWRTGISKLDEGLVNKGLLAGLLMTAGLTYGQLKPEYKAKIDSIQKVQTLSPQEKRAEIQKIVQLNRDEISGKHKADFKKSMTASGFTDEEEYKKYLSKNSKKPNVGLDGLNIGAANKRGATKGSCSTGQSNRGESLKDTK